MNVYETLTLVISLLAVIVSAISLIRTHTISSQQFVLEKKTADLAQKQLELIEAKEKELSVAKIDVELAGAGSDYKLVITNIGGVEAKDVNISFDGKGYPLVASEYAEKIPISVLRPGKSVELLAPKTMGCGSQYLTQVRWLNPDGTQGKDEIVVHW